MSSIALIRVLLATLVLLVLITNPAKEQLPSDAEKRPENGYHYHIPGSAPEQNPYEGELSPWERNKAAKTGAQAFAWWYSGGTRGNNDHAGAWSTREGVGCGQREAR
jgi:hypothetical protein